MKGETFFEVPCLNHEFYHFFKFAIICVALDAYCLEKILNFFSRFSFHCNPREKLSDD